MYFEGVAHTFEHMYFERHRNWTFVLLCFKPCIICYHLSKFEWFFVWSFFFIYEMYNGDVASGLSWWACI